MKLLLLIIGMATVLPIVFRHSKHRRTANVIAGTTWGFFIAAPVFFMGTVMAVSMSANNADMRALQEGLASIEHPILSKFVASYTDIDGNDPCTFFVGELRTSPLSRKEILSFYIGKTMQPTPPQPHWIWNGAIPYEVPLYVSFVDDPWIANDRWWSEQWGRDLKKITERKETLYVISSSTDGNFSFGDFRCRG